MMNQSLIWESGVSKLELAVKTLLQEDIQHHISEVLEKMQGLLDQT